MIFQVGNNPEGYVVSCYHDLLWHPLRNFGERQGDARDFMLYDCPKLPLEHIRTLERNYSKSKVYKRINGRRFVAEQDQDAGRSFFRQI